MAIETLIIEDLDRNGLQTRVALDEATVIEYSEAMRGKAHFPPVTAFFDGKHIYLADGFHRTEAALRCGWKKIKADVREGTFADALKHALGANANHGLRRTNADKQRCLQMAWENRRALFGRDDADPSAEILADVCGVTRVYAQQFVSNQPVNNLQVENTKTSQNKLPPPQRRVFGKDGKTRTVPVRPVVNRAMNDAAQNPPTRPVPTRPTETDATTRDGTTVTNATNGTGGKCAYADKDGFCTNEESQGGGFKCCHCAGFTPVKKGYHIGADGKQHADGVLLDRFGVEIPDALRAVFSSTQLADWEHRISMVKSEIKGARALGNPIAKGLQRAVIELDNAYHEVKAAEPWCVCRVCQGQGCKACGDNGYQTEEQYKRNPEEMK